jgi:hypothetical protein
VPHRNRSGEAASLVAGRSLPHPAKRLSALRTDLAGGVPFGRILATLQGRGSRGDGVFGCALNSVLGAPPIHPRIL